MSTQPADSIFWRIAHEVYFPKNKPPNPNSIKDFRPISLMNVEGKLFFSLVSKRFVSHIIKNNKFINASATARGRTCPDADQVIVLNGAVLNMRGDRCFELCSTRKIRSTNTGFRQYSNLIGRDALGGSFLIIKHSGLHRYLFAYRRTTVP